MSAQTDGPIEHYLDELYAQLRTDPRASRRLLEEAGDHLYDTSAELQDSGMDPLEAEREAVRRFGATRPIVRAHQRRSFGRLAVDTAQAALFLGAVGLTAVGASGLLVAAMSALVGRDFVGAQLPNWVSVAGGHPASVAENADDAVALRVLAGLAGLVVLAALWAVRRARPGVRLRVLPIAYVDVIGLVAFGAATVALGAASVDQLVNHAGRGAGYFLSGAIVSAVGMAIFGVRAARDLLRPRID
jgi:hypothetical protein